MIYIYPVYPVKKIGFFILLNCFGVPCARVAEMVDALDLGSSGLTPMRVRLSPLAPENLFF